MDQSIFTFVPPSLKEKFEKIKDPSSRLHFFHELGQSLEHLLAKNSDSEDIKS